MSKKLRLLLVGIVTLLGATLLSPVSPASAGATCWNRDTDCEDVIDDGRWHYAVFTMTDTPSFHGNDDICGDTPRNVKISLTVKYRTKSNGVEIGYLYLRNKTNVELSPWRWAGEPGDGTFLQFWSPRSLKKYQASYLADIGGKISGHANWHHDEALFEIYLRPTNESASCALAYYASLRK